MCIKSPTNTPLSRQLMISMPAFTYITHSVSPSVFRWLCTFVFVSARHLCVGQVDVTVDVKHTQIRALHTPHSQRGI